MSLAGEGPSARFRRDRGFEWRGCPRPSREVAQGELTIVTQPGPWTTGQIPERMGPDVTGDSWSGLTPTYLPWMVTPLLLPKRRAPTARPTSRKDASVVGSGTADGSSLKSDNFPDGLTP